MKRTDFTQNFPGGIIKGDSRCREGEEMEEKIDLNVCYRRAFEALGITGSVQKFTDYITEYAPVVLIVLAPKSNKNAIYDASLIMGNLMQQLMP